MSIHPLRPFTLKDRCVFIERHGTKTQIQDLRKARTVFTLHGIEGPDFDRFPADLKEYRERVPQLRGKMPALQALIQAAGISDNTYKQCWRAGKRLVEIGTGAAAEKQERKSRDDDWASFLETVDKLVAARFVLPQTRVSLTFLADHCRAIDIPLRSINSTLVRQWMENGDASQRKRLKSGLRTLDHLRSTPRLRPLLPANPVAPPPKQRGRLKELPVNLQVLIERSVEVAAKEQVEDEKFKHLAKPLADATAASYKAALSSYFHTLLEVEKSFAESLKFQIYFTQSRVESVFAAWQTGTNISKRTKFSYASDVAIVLARNGHAEEADFVAGLIKVLPTFKLGRAENKIMSAKVKRWCQSLLRKPDKNKKFQIQHFYFFEQAREALDEAKRLGLDPVALSKPEELKNLPKHERAYPRLLLRKARMFGLMAAYSAIALEGAPFRRMNMLTLRHTGPNKTMHLHLSGSPQRVIIKFPNDELKNGAHLSERGEELEPIEIVKRGKGDIALEIIGFYLREIRPLFQEADKTHCFFPPLTTAKNAEDGFCKGTFYLWLAEASAEIGLPMTSHNYRHGYCSIDINEGRRSMEDLAKILGDTVAVVQRNYAWINSKQSVENVQRDVAQRRAMIAKAKGVF